MKFRIQFYLFLSFGALGMSAAPVSVNELVNEDSMVGETRVNVFIWDLYDISLHAADRQFDWDKPFALRLQYLRKLKGKMIAERSIEEMRRQGVSEVKLAAWYTQLEEVFPDVEKGTELIGIFLPGESTRFYKDGKFIGQVLDPAFIRPFGNIWLGKNSSIPSIRTELLADNS